jgi:A/G-specific adenine glycosylase
MNKLPKNNFFTKKLLYWNRAHNTRTMPWKGERDPYRIWLSEIILQQTRVEQGLEYYNRFLEKYPSVDKLALAEETEIFKLWEGLGYYSRCKNLIFTARQVAFDLFGVFPQKYDDILKLKGVGPYTAAAIASFAFDLSHAVVDGNVFRVLSRFFGITIPVDSAAGKKYFSELAQTLLKKNEPAAYNQAIMDFGATICKPKLPLCNACILNSECLAFQNRQVKNLPVKEKKLVKTTRFFYYIITVYNQQIFIRRRDAKDIWQNLWEFNLIEKQSRIPAEEIINSEEFKNISGKKFKLKNISSVYKQQLTHQIIETVFISIEINKPHDDKSFTKVDKNEIKRYAFPRSITNYFEKNLFNG